VLGPGGVIPSDPSDSRSLHRWEREVCAAQFPASRGAPFTISHDAPPSGGACRREGIQAAAKQTVFEWAGQRGQGSAVYCTEVVPLEES